VYVPLILTLKIPTFYGGSGVRQNTAVLKPTLFCWRRHVSATGGHLQVTKMYTEENYTECDHGIGASFKLPTRSHCRLEYAPIPRSV